MREELVTSRVGYTRKLVDVLRRLNKRPRILLSGSAIGIYGDRGEEVLDEQSKPVKGRAHLLVTVPLYMKWDQPEVSR